MSLSDLVASRFTFGFRFNDPQPVPAGNANSWLASQLAAPAEDDPAVLTRLAQVQLPITLTAADGTSTTENPGAHRSFQIALRAVGHSGRRYQRQQSGNQAADRRGGGGQVDPGGLFALAGPGNDGRFLAQPFLHRRLSKRPDFGDLADL